MAIDIEAERAKISAYLREKFQGKALTSGKGPRHEGTFTEQDVCDAVAVVLRDLDDPSVPSGRVLTGLTAADERALGHHVPANVPNHARLECAGIDVNIDPADPTRINLWPKAPAWVWDDFGTTL